MRFYGKLLSGFTTGLGRTAVLSTKLKAILHGVRTAKQCGFRKVIIESNNLEAVDMLNAVLEMHSNCNSIIRAMRDLLELGNSFWFIHGIWESN